MASLQGLTVVFTGFRDEALQEKIEGRGGHVTSSVTGQTDVLVAAGSKGVQSAKARKAREQGVRVLSRDAFAAEFFPPSLMDRLRGRASSASAPSTNDRCYLTHDNGGRAFRVCYNGQSFWAFKKRGPGLDASADAVAVKPTRYARVFVGRSPLNAMTKFSGGHGPRFDGNSMLFELPRATASGASGASGARRYVFVGTCVLAFGTRSPIVSFVSPVGNSDVPYPYAVDRSGVVYLLIEGVTLMPAGKDKGAPVYAEDPYGYYYRHGLLTPDLGRVGSDSRPVEVFEGITKFFIGADPYTFTYVPHPAPDFERISHFQTFEKSLIKRTQKKPTPIYVVAHGVKRQLSKKEYVDLMRRVGKQRGFAPLKSKVLVSRED